MSQQQSELQWRLQQQQAVPVAAGGAGGTSAPEKAAQSSYKKASENIRGEQLKETVPGGMTAAKSSMQQLPDCGEFSYKGSGKLAGKKAMITGGDSGIGRAVSIAYAREGADVCIVYKSNKGDAEDTARICQEAGVQVYVMQADVGQQSECHRAIDACVEEIGGITTLVCNAGVQYTEDSLDDITPERFNTVFNTNVGSVFYLAQRAVKHYTPDSGCTIINCASVNTYKGNASLVSYAASKGAMTTLTRSLALKLVDQGVRVNSVAPGPIWTPFIGASMPPQKVEHFGENTPMGRAGQPAECAPAFVFLACADSSYMTGQTLHVDGGMWMGS